MPSSPDQWPALASSPVDGQRSLALERAVWDGQAWRGANGFDPAAHGLDLALRLGDEDAAASGLVWLATNHWLVAMAFRPRSDAGPGLAKALLASPRSVGMPTTLAAAAMLDALSAATASDSADPLPALPEKVSIRPERSAADIGEGARQLFTVMSEDDLTALYAAILAGDQVVPICQRPQPLSARAIIALLAPLERAIADDLSIAGWWPSLRMVADTLLDRWRVVVCGRIDGVSRLSRSAPRDDHRQQATRMVAALRHNQPGLIADGAGAIAAPSASAARAAGAGRQVRIALWGLPAAGKTTLLMALLSVHRPELARTNWSFGPTAQADQLMASIRETMQANRFPKATTIQERPECFELVATNSTTGNQLKISVEDRAGGEWKTLNEALARQLQDDTDGVVLLLDPERTDADPEIMRIVTKLYGHGAPNPGRPLAVCVSMCDRLLSSFADAEVAWSDPESFIEQIKQNKLIERYRDSLGFIAHQVNCKAFFPVSAVGVRPRCGLLLPTVIYDDDLIARPLWTGNETIHVERPFEWILEQIVATPP